MMKEQGAISMQLTRSLDDPNVVIVHSTFADSETAKAFMTLIEGDGFRKGDPVVKGGVIPDMIEIWLGEDA